MMWPLWNAFNICTFHSCAAGVAWLLVAYMQSVALLLKEIHGWESGIFIFWILHYSAFIIYDSFWQFNKWCTLIFSLSWLKWYPEAAISWTVHRPQGAGGQINKTFRGFSTVWVWMWLNSKLQYSGGVFLFREYKSGRIEIHRGRCVVITGKAYYMGIHTITWLIAILYFFYY